MTLLIWTVFTLETVKAYHSLDFYNYFLYGLEGNICSELCMVNLEQNQMQPQMCSAWFIAKKEKSRLGFLLGK